MRNRLKELFGDYVWAHVMLGARSLTLLTGLWFLSALVLETLNYQPAGILRNGGSTLLAFINALGLTFVVIALLRRLLEIINGQRAAVLKDLGYIGYAYCFAIAAFAAIYLAADIFGGESFIHTNNANSPFKIFDYLYLSGITIATVGYGDIVPKTTPTKLLVVLEAIVGLWLTVTVLGVFIGSLLGRQLQDKQARFFTDFQRAYFTSLGDCQRLMKDLDKLQPDQISDFRRDVLKTISYLVRLLYEPSPSAKVHANWMRFYTGGEAPEAALDIARQFVVPHLNSQKAIQNVWGVLVLQEWDSKPTLMPGKGEFVLPVYNPADEGQSEYQLPGAPQTLGREQGYVIVSDVLEMNFDNQNRKVMRALKNYFRERAKEIRSFASVSIWDRGIPFGVINIQSNEPNLCGTSPESQRILVDMIQPFAAYLVQTGLESVGRKETVNR